MNQRTFTTFVILILIFFQAYFLGTSDLASLILLMLSTVIIFRTLLKLQTGNKRAIRANSKEGSFLYRFLSEEKTFFLISISFIASLISSIIMVLILKGITFNHGYWGLFIIMGLISLTVFSFLSNDKTTSSTVNNNLQDDVGKHANNMLQIILTAIILNFSLSFILSAHDTMSLLNSHITLNDFEDFALKNSVERSDILNNYYSRLMINLYLLLDAFKLALTTQIIDILIPSMEERLDWFYLFYGVVFVLNMMKLFLFSFAFVLLQKGLESFSRKGLQYANTRISKVRENMKKNDDKK